MRESSKPGDSERLLKNTQKISSNLSHPFSNATSTQDSTIRYVAGEGVVLYNIMALILCALLTIERLKTKTIKITHTQTHTPTPQGRSQSLSISTISLRSTSLP